MNSIVGRDIKEEDSIGELDFDNTIPKPLHGSTIGDVRIASLPTSELCNKVIVGTNNGSSRVTTFGE